MVSRKNDVNQYKSKRKYGSRKKNSKKKIINKHKSKRKDGSRKRKHGDEEETQKYRKRIKKSNSEDVNNVYMNRSRLNKDKQKISLSEKSSVNYTSNSQYTDSMISTTLSKTIYDLSELKKKHHDDIIGDLDRLLSNVSTDIDNEFEKENNKVYRLFKYYDDKPKQIRYINIIYYNKNLDYLYKYIKFILNSGVNELIENNLYIFNIICDIKTYDLLKSEKKMSTSTMSICDSDDEYNYESFTKIINEQINNCLKSKFNLIIDLYGCKHRLSYGISFKRAFGNKLLTDNITILTSNLKESSSTEFNETTFNVLNIDDNITDITDFNKCIGCTFRTNPNSIPSNVCVSIIDVYDALLVISENNKNILVNGIGAGSGMGADIKTNIKTFKSNKLYKLTLQKVFMLKNKNIFYYPYFSTCCEDRLFNAMAIEYCNMNTTYKLRYGHFKKGLGDDVFQDEHIYKYENGQVGTSKIYYNKILNFLIDLKYIYGDMFSYEGSFHNSYSLKLNNDVIIAADPGTIQENDAQTRYGAYQVAIYVIYYLFGNGYELMKDNLNYYKTLAKNRWLPGSVEYAFNLAHKYFHDKKNRKDPKTIQQFGEKIYSTLIKYDENEGDSEETKLKKAEKRSNKIKLKNKYNIFNIYEQSFKSKSP